MRQVKLRLAKASMGVRPHSKVTDEEWEKIEKALAPHSPQRKQGVLKFRSVDAGIQLIEFATLMAWSSAPPDRVVLGGAGA